MCKIIEEYGDERAALSSAETLIKYVENLAESTQSIDEACRLLKITHEQYDDAKKLVEATLV